MNKLADILKVIGGVILVFSAVITFKITALDNIVYMTNEGESIPLDDIIYFRGLLLGSIFILVGSAITTKRVWTQNMLLALGAGDFLVLIASIHNLIFDSIVNLDFYFDMAVYGSAGSLLVIILARIIVNFAKKIKGLWQRIFRRLFKSSIF